jgi:anti-anti-sigma factor
MALDAPQRLESIPTVKQIALELELEVRPAAAHVPDIIAIGIVGAALAQPREGTIQDGAGGHLADPVRRSSRIFGWEVPHEQSCIGKSRYWNDGRTQTQAAKILLGETEAGTAGAVYLTPRPEGAESTLTENAASPFQAEPAHYNGIVLNLGKVDYIDSGGLGILVELRTSAQNAGGTIKLTGLTKRVSDLLQITKLLTVFDVYNSEAEAVESFRKAA